MAQNKASHSERAYWKLHFSMRARLAIKAVAVVLAAIALVVFTARTSKWLTVERLASRIRSSDDSMAGQLVGELAAFGGTAYPALVAAANSERSSVALAARLEIDQLIDQWQQASYLHPATFAINGQALPMAEAFEHELPNMTASGRRWARRVLTAMVGLSQQQGFYDRLALITVCDRALSSLPADTAPLPFESDVDYRLTLAPPPRVPLFAGMGTGSSAMVDQPRSVDLPASKPLATTSLPVPQAKPPSLSEIPLTPERPPEPGPSQWDPSWSAVEIDELPSTTVGTGRVPAHSASTQLAPPPTAIDSKPKLLDVTQVPQLDERTEQVLFELLASGSSDKQAAAADALLLRGYGSATPLDARMLTSPSPADRLAMIDLAMTSPRLEARKWLWRLAHDSSGEVRAAAVASISTSGDRTLIEATLKLAMHDTDPRVAAQSPMLQKMLK